MTDTFALSVEKAAQSRLSEVDFSNLKFGKHHTDHMLVADYADGQWQQVRILPYGPLPMDPAMSAIHYGQSIFEGMKAYKSAAGEVQIFRPWANHQRLNASAARMMMPAMPEDLFMEALSELLRQDAAWVPDSPGSSLYIRPCMFATDAFVGVRPSDTYRFLIFCSPVGPYYAEPLKVKIETEYMRAAQGGVGFAKCAGNYAAAMLPTKLAADQGYHQVLWTDAHDHRYFEESGTMNVMFVVDGTLLTPDTGDTVLRGVTRDSIITLARSWGMPVETRRVSIDEIMRAQQEGRLQEAFGTGTAAVVSPIAIIGYQGQDYALPATTPIADRLKTELEAIRTGRQADVHGWMLKV
jgi:branched-chain amino acid aminotransferase